MTAVDAGGYRRDYGFAPTTRTLEEVQELHDFDFVNFAQRRMSETGQCAVMDVGCGNSTFLTELAQRVGGISILGVDLYTPAERGFHPDAQGLQPEIQASGNHMPMVADESHDLIVSTWSVSAYGVSSSTFADAPTNYVSEFGRILRPGGLASIRPESMAIEILMHDDTAFERIATNRIGAEIIRAVNRRALDYRRLVSEGYTVMFDDEDHTARIRRGVSEIPDATLVNFDEEF